MMSLLRSIVKEELRREVGGRRTEPLTEMEEVRAASKRAYDLNQKMPFLYGAVGAVSGHPVEGMVEGLFGWEGVGKVRTPYSYLLGTILSRKDEHVDKVRRWLSYLANHLDDYTSPALFHGTSSDLLGRILKEGLKPPKETGELLEPTHPEFKDRHRLRSTVALHMAPGYMFSPDPEYFARYAHFSELRGKKTGVPVILGISKEALTESDFSTAISEAEVGVSSVRPRHITHVFVPEEYLEEVRKNMSGRVKVLPMEPLLLAVLLARHGFSIWGDRHLDAELRYLEKMHGAKVELRRQNGTVLYHLKKEPFEEVIRVEEPVKLGPNELRALEENHGTRGHLPWR